MKIDVKMPDLATAGGELKIVKWLVEVGQRIERGQALLEVETDKAVVEVEAFTSGIFLEARVKVNDLVTVGNVIAVIETM